MCAPSPAVRSTTLCQPPACAPAVFQIVSPDTVAAEIALNVIAILLLADAPAATEPKLAGWRDAIDAAAIGDAETLVGAPPDSSTAAVPTVLAGWVAPPRR